MSLRTSRPGINCSQFERRRRRTIPPQVNALGLMTQPPEKEQMADNRGPWWGNTWWGRRTTAVNLSIVVILLLIVLWKALLP